MFCSNARPLWLKFSGSQTRLMTLASSAGAQTWRAKKVCLEAGNLVEFKKDSGEVGLGVTLGRAGKKSWLVLDQNAETFTVPTRQVNIVVPGGNNYKPKDVSELLQKMEPTQDPTHLEAVWKKILTSCKAVDLEELALLLYGVASPDKCYSAYCLLNSCPFYFECIDSSLSPLYEPRPPEQVLRLRLHALQEEAAQKKLLDFVAVVKSAVKLPLEQKQKRSYWESMSEFQIYVESLRTIALQSSVPMEKRVYGMQILDALGIPKNTAGAIDLMIQMGYFGFHENVELLKLDIPVSFSKSLAEAAKAVIFNSPIDVDKEKRVDLTALKVFLIDVDNPKEVDDGLSAAKLPDGRFKVWIHVTDPAHWIAWNSALQKEAGRRGTSIYLPAMTIPMFPPELALDRMSLKQGRCHPAISISATLSLDGSIAESCVENSVVCPTYNLSYEAATDLLVSNSGEETELSILYQAALLRHKWRITNGASNLYVPKPMISVEGEETSYPKISITMNDESSMSFILVKEMMVLCGEIIAKYGGEMGLSLPYRSQAANEELDKEALTIPEGPARALALLRSSLPSSWNCSKPSRHASLGLPGYVQFTSPIRRYVDLLSHFQIKSVLRGEEPRFLPDSLEASLVTVNNACKQARKLQIDSERYWSLEYLQRQPAKRKYQACVLRCFKNATALILIIELGLQNLMDLKLKRQPGEEFFVRVASSVPRKSFLYLKEC